MSVLDAGTLFGGKVSMSVWTRIVLDDDVVEGFDEESRGREISFREALNGAAREGLLAPE